jgi:L-glutamine:scyllo-inosose aminotransferase/L-glutamine:2-deoxy-scyllo-inosose/3-amino-2,3-dideoxy-scyllo-inosose aminotransferase
MWPRADAGTYRAVRQVLRSGRWSISGVCRNSDPFEPRFAQAFAHFHDVPHCVPVTSGSMALVVALRALGVGPGDEVLVPGLTWVACASSVLSIGAVPVLVDVDSRTLCMSADAARAAIRPSTAAILLVHQYCTVADIDAFLAISRDTGVPLIEDCSQAHGASWNGRRVGTYGRVGTFSMQTSKVLTAGEGGAVITCDVSLHDTMQQLRADGRRWSANQKAVGQMGLEEIGTVQGYNHCLSEFHAAILLDRLQHLDTENLRRECAGEWLGRNLAELGVAYPLFRLPKVDKRPFYNFCVRLNPEAFSGRGPEIVAAALGAEISGIAEPVDSPLNRNRLYNPLASPLVNRSERLRQLVDPTQFPLPEAEKAYRECVTLPHPVLLSDEDGLAAIVEAFDKVSHLSAELPVADAPVPVSR